MKMIKKIGVLMLSLCLLMQVWGIEAHAASGTVSLSGTSGNVGSTVTVKGSIKSSSGAIGAADVVILYNSSGLQFISGSASNGSAMVSGGSGSITYTGSNTDSSVTSLNFTLKFKILAEGSFSVSVSSANIWNYDGEQLGESKGSATVKGKAVTSSSSSSSSNNQQDTRDSNANLSSLEIYPGTLSPVFKKDIMSYTVTVPGDTTELTISATAESSKAKVTVSGNTGLKLGENIAKVVVMAENDSTKVYEITIICGEKEKIEINGTENTIYEDFTDEQIPAGFARTKVTYNGHEYEALTNEAGNIKLMSLQNGDVTNFYIYNQALQTFIDFVPVQIAPEKYIYLIPLNEGNEAFADYTKTRVTIQEKMFDAWKLDDDFSLVSALSQNGEEVLYQYDSVDGTFQRYAEIEKTVVDEDKVEESKIKWPEISLDYLWYALIGVSGLALILFICMIYFIATRKMRHKARKNRVQKKAEKAAAKAEKVAAKENAKAEKIAAKENAKAEKIAAKENAKAEKIAAKENAKAEKVAAKETKKADKLAAKEAKKMKKEE